MADLERGPKFDQDFSEKAAVPAKKRGEFSSRDHLLRKRQPSAPTRTRGQDIFVTNKTNFRAQLSKCEKLLENEGSQIVIHGLGAAVPRACLLALRLKEIHHGTLELDIKTSTVPIIDDLEPLTDSVDYEINERQNSAIHIRVFRKLLIGGLRYPASGAGTSDRARYGG